MPTKRLNEQVKRNKNRFPEDFMFQLSAKEKAEVVAICDHLSKLTYSKTLPYAFTEQGVSMLSSVLNSERAIEVNIAIMRLFVKFRQLSVLTAEIEKKLREMGKVEKIIGQLKKIAKILHSHDDEIKTIFEIVQMMLLPAARGKGKNKPKIGFKH